MKHINTLSFRQLYFFCSLLTILILGNNISAKADPARMVKDINSILSPAGSNPHNFFNIGSDIFFAASNPFGTELWKTDGTSDGTAFIKDISTGPIGSFPKQFIDVNGTLLFVADDHSQDIDDGIWKSDGTEEGTVLVKDFRPNHFSRIVFWDVINGFLIFLADDGIHGMELWRTDGTPEGTSMIKDIDPENGFLQYKFARVNDILVFAANDGIHGNEIWRTDGTEEGTFMLRDIYPGGDIGEHSNPDELTYSNGFIFFKARSSFSAFGLWKTDGTIANTVVVNSVINPAHLEDANGTLFFNGQNFALGFELYKSDGTHAGTEMVKDINQTVNQFGVRQSSNPLHLTNVNGTLFFIADDGLHGKELWKSDGTEAGTVLVKDIRPGIEGSDFDPTANNYFLTNVNGRLFLKPNDGVHGPEVWTSDGTEEGTLMVKDILPGSEGSFTRNFIPLGGKLLFTAINDENGKELWVSDGTPEGTFVHDISPGPSSSNPDALREINGLLYFNASDHRGTELWKSDGTPEGTTLVADLNIMSPMSNPFSMFDAAGTLFFVADDGIHGRELWKSDGTEGGTSLVKDIFPGNQSTDPSRLAAVNGELFFNAGDGVVSGLWKSDGTEAGTIFVKEISLHIGHPLSRPTQFNNTLFFAGDDGILGGELWKSDGTEAGTVLVSDIFSGDGSSLPDNWLEVNGILYFTADDGVQGKELWKTDGTESGTVLVSDIFSGINSSDPSDLVELNGNLLFIADDGTHGRDLWKSDGTAAGTTLVFDFERSTFVPPPDLTVVNETLFFLADNGDGRFLWKSDGTTAGTLVVKSITPRYLTAVDNTLFFGSWGNNSDFELWKSDGTEAGTVLVKDIFLGADSNGNPNSSNPSDLVNANGLLFFNADDGIHQREPWISDGTEAGTIMIQDIHPVPGQDSFPLHPKVAGDNLFFNADDGFFGRELWALDLSDSDGDGIIDVLDPNDDFVVLNLPSGASLFFIDNSFSVILHTDTAETIAVADVDNNGKDDVIASFLVGNGPGGTGGTFISRNQGPLTLLDSKIAEQIAVGNFDGTDGDDLFLDFGTDGLWFSFNDGAVAQLTAESPVTMAVGDLDNSGQDDVVLSLNSVGIVAIKNASTEEVLDSTPANVLELADVDGNGEDDLFASFSAGSGPGGTGGLFASVNQGALFPLSPLETLNMTHGDFDGSGQDDLLLDFGGATGLQVLLNGTSVSPLGNVPVVAMTSGDVDNSGQDDIILSITGVGTIVFKDLTTVEALDPAVALDLATGHVDGN
jgi:ELWxxDGT repeat protein